MHAFLQDGRLAARALWRAPGFTAATVLTLALGIGANAAIFNVAWHVLLAPLPYPDPDRLVIVWEGFGPEREINPVAPALFLDWRREGTSFETIAAYNQFRSRLNLTGTGDPEELNVTWVTGDYFRVLGVPATAGRPIGPADDAGSRQVVVLSERLWRRTFGADPRVIGRTVQLHGEPFEIVGVMPDRAALEADGTDAWVRLSLDGEAATRRQAHYLRVVARLRAGVSPEQADAEAQAITARAAALFPAPGVAESARVVPLREEVSGEVRPTVLLLWTGAALVLLVACANVAGLQFARQSARRRDAAIHAALGATHARLARRQFAEALLISIPAGYAGLLLGIWVVSAVSAAAPDRIATGLSPVPDGIVVAYTFGLSILAAAIGTMAGAWSAPRTSLARWLVDRGEDAPRGRVTRVLLVSAQVAATVLVLAGAALLVSSLVRVLGVNPGFTLERGLIVNLELPDRRYPDAEARSRFYDAAIERVEALPGVEGACAMTTAPLVPQPGSMTWVPEGETRMVGSLPAAMTPSCFSVLGIPLQRGRAFESSETEPVAIVSASMARALWVDADPIGRRIHMGVPDGPLVTVVGVTGDIHKTSLEIAYGRQVWLPASAGLYPPRQLIVRTAVPPAPLVAAVRGAIRGVDPDLPVTRVETMADVRAHNVAGRRFGVVLLAAYGLAGLILCAVGIHGLLAETVSQRTREIGIRMALGAAPGTVVREVVGGAATSLAVGALAGVGAAVLLMRSVRHLLFGVTPGDPAAYLAVLALVVLVGIAAAYLPARRATRVDPIAAIRTT